MLDKDLLKNKLFDMLDRYNGQLSKYKELREGGLAKDDTFELIIAARKEVVSAILDIVNVHDKK